MISVSGGLLHATLVMPEANRPLVVFAHGSGSSRFSPRNRFIAEQLVNAGFGTLLLDLLTEAEDAVYENRFDMPLLAGRLVQAINWCSATIDQLAGFALFGASTGAAAALIAASDLGKEVKTVVSRGGRPDLAMEALGSVKCPTLLIVGGLDEQVIELNRRALSRFSDSTTSELAIVPGATHLFEEPGTLEQVANLTLRWLEMHTRR